MSGKKEKVLRKRVKKIMEKNDLDPSTFKRRMKMAKRAARMGILSILALLFVNLSHADTIELLRGVDPHKFKEVMLEKGFKLDFELKDKTDDSWGVLGMDKRGMYISTYDPIDMDNLPFITEAMWASMEIVKESDD